MFFSVYSFATLLCFIGTINAQKNTTSAPKIAYFYFDTPTSRTDVSVRDLPLVRAGDNFRIEWNSKPSNPDVVTLEVRYGTWPDVGPWVVIAREVENNNYFDWKTPENLVKGKYIFQISTPKTTTQWVNQTSQPITVYQGKDAINGKIFIDSGISMQPAAYVTIFGLFMTVFYTMMI